MEDRSLKFTVIVNKIIRHCCNQKMSEEIVNRFNKNRKTLKTDAISLRAKHKPQIELEKSTQFSIDVYKLKIKVPKSFLKPFSKNR